jgi:ABC-type bacteriocin/lantibiotic exporter with double-glycine peptidase domain
MNRILQESESGCFVACFAMLADLSYEAAFKVVFPGQFRTPYNGDIALDEAPNKLKQLGWKIRRIRAKHLDKLTKDALIFITWKDEPERSHSVVWDAKQKQVLDPIPSYHRLPHRVYERQLTTVIYIDHKPNYNGAKS